MCSYLGKGKKKKVTWSWRRMGELSSIILDLSTRYKWMISFTLLQLYSRVPIAYKVGWTSQLVCMLWSKEKYFIPTGNRTPVVWSLARRCTEWAFLSFMYLNTFGFESRSGNMLSCHRLLLLFFMSLSTKFWCSYGLKMGPNVFHHTSFTYEPTI
jgi:hypothetical protein